MTLFNEQKKDADKLILTRRSFIHGALGLAGLGSMPLALATMPKFRKTVLDGTSKWNDSVQGLLFSPEKLAPNYKKSDITQAFPYNGFYPEAYAPKIDPERWQLALGENVQRKTPITLSELRGMEQESQITQLICIEGWSAIGEWSGVRLANLLSFVGADINAPCVRLDCEYGYFTSIDMASALHPQTLLALDFLGQPWLFSALVR